MSSEMDTLNRHLVGMQGGKIVIMSPPLGGMTKEQALVLAAWIVAVADPRGEDFQKVLDAVIST